MQGIYNYTPEINHVSRENSVSAALYLQFVLHVTSFHMSNVMYFDISTLGSMCAVTNMAVFLSSLIPCFPGMVPRYCLKDFEMVTVAPVITGITFVFTFHMRWISTVRFLYFRLFSASFLITFLSWICNTYKHTCSFFTITDYDVRFIVSNGSVSLHLLISWYC